MTTYEPLIGPAAPVCADVTIHVGDESGFDRATASLAFPLTDMLENEAILVLGTFTIDKDFTFKQCTIFMAEGAQIVTLEDEEIDLVGINSYFTFCEEEAWESIQINANGAIRLENCVVTGALNGLEFKKDYRAGSSMLTNNWFQRNRHSIVSLDYGTILTFTEFVHNQFSGYAEVPGTGALPLSGIRLSGCKAIIGTPVIYNDPADYLDYANRFYNYRFGIEAFTGTTTAYIANCFFASMRADLQNGALTGCGINAVGATVVVSGFEDASSGNLYGHCEFQGCASAGIRARQCMLNVEHAEFYHEQIYGISSLMTGFRSQIIERCDFKVGNFAITRAGVFLERPNGSGRMYSTRINDNTLQLVNNFSPVTGINVRCPVSSTDHMAVNRNKINLMYSIPTYPYNGILIYGNQSDNIELKGDTVSAAHDIANGIFMSNMEGFNHLLDGNVSTGGAMRNYYLEKSRNVKYCENISDGGTYGFHFNGDNDNSNWSVNGIGTHDIGLFIDDMGASSGRISTQVRKGNLWEEDNNVYVNAARCDADPTNSKFEIEDDSDPQIFPTNIEPATGWFFEQPGDLNYCSSTVRHISPFEDELASGGTLAISEAEEWEATRLLLETLLRYPGHLTGDTVMQNFYTANLTTTTAGQFAQINQLIREGGFSTSPWWDVREAKQEQFEAAKIILDSLNARDTLSDLANNIFIPGDAMLPVVHAEMIALTDSLEIIEAILSSAHDAVLTQALLELDSIAITEDYEEAYKILITYQIKTALGYEPEDAGYEDLMDLTDLDETVYGAAVRHARYYLSECDRYERIAPEPEEEERVVPTTTPNRTPATLAIVPNPATGNIRVTLEHALGGGQWSIVSPFGTCIYTGQWPDGQPSQQIGLEGMASGAYYFVVRTNTGAILAQKLMVLH